MHPKYITACKAAGRIVPEDDYEWGNPKNGFFDQLTSMMEKKLAAAAFKWRVDVQSGKTKGALEGIRWGLERNALSVKGHCLKDLRQ